MAHVALSVSELYEPEQPRARFEGSLDLWSFAAGAANEPCVLVDAAGIVVSVSPACGPLFGIDPAEVTGRPLVDGVLRLLDFNRVSGELPGWEVDKIPPLLALTTGGLARGLIRVPGIAGGISTVDAISVPLRDGADVVGSLTFFALVTR